MSLLDSLNDPQRAAVLHGDGPILVLAGAGSGKTRVLTTRIAHLIQERGVLPEQVLAVTFTNKAAKEMRERLEVLLGEEASGVWAGTFHAFGVRVLRRAGRRIGLPSNFAILDADDTKKVMKRVVGALGPTAAALDSADWHNRISSAKNALETPQTIAEKVAATRERLQDADRQFPGVYAAYQEALRQQGAVDFDDLLMLPAQLLASDVGRDIRRSYNDQFKHVLVDEYQDTNGAQYRMVRLLMPATGNILVVGDDDQAIYTWRGASIDHILGFQRDFPTANVVRLEENYRSTGHILTAANSVIARNTERLGKTLHTRSGNGEQLTIAVAPTDWDEARFVAQEAETQASIHGASGVAILYRTNAQSRLLEESLNKRGIIYRLVGGHAFYDRKEVRDALAWAKLAARPKDTVAFARAVQTPRRGIGEKTVDKIIAEAQAANVPVMDIARARSEGKTVAAGALRTFCDMIDVLAQHVANDDLGGLLQDCVMTTGLYQSCVDEGEAGVNRTENLDELIRAAREWADPMADAEEVESSAVSKFLEQVALQGKADAEDGREADCVTLMTVHAAKGLEFPAVILVGMDEGLFPHKRSIGDPARIEEERRLCYVAITRARESLTITRAQERKSGGPVPETKPSRFLDDIPISTRIIRHLGSSYTPGHTQNRWQQAINDSRRGSFGGSTAARRVSAEGATAGFQRGQRVQHPQYGDGVIHAIGNGDNGAEIEVAFEDGDLLRTFTPSIAPSRLTRR